MHDSLTVANRFLELDRAKQGRATLSPMQLLKLVYLGHGWKLGLYGSPLIVDEIQAWQYGPVIPKLYNKTRKFKDGTIVERLPSPGGDVLEDAEQDLLRQVYDIYGDLSGPALSRLTHAPGSPWDIVYQPGSFGLVISNDLIEDYYKRQAKRA